MFAWQATVQNDVGNIVPLPVVTVFEADGVTLASIYDGAGGALANPLTGGMDGFIQFWADAGHYTIEGASATEATDTWTVTLGSPDYLEISNNLSDLPNAGVARENIGLGAGIVAAASRVTDWNTVSQSGFYYSVAGDLNSPGQNRYSGEASFSSPERGTITVRRGNGSSETWIRQKSEGVWLPWSRVMLNEDVKLNPSNKVVEVIAHRGFVNQNIENTIQAWSSAIGQGADSLECDVQVTADGVLRVFHDDTVDALTSGTGAFSTLSDSYVASLRYLQADGTLFAGEGIPLFSEMLEVAKGFGCMCYVEIKGYRTQSDIDLMVNAIKAAGMENLVVLQSFTFSDLEYVRSINNNIAIGSLTVNSTNYASMIDRLAELGNGYALISMANLRLAGLALPNYARSMNVGVGVWTINTRAVFNEAVSLGVTKIMCDYSMETK